MKLSKKHNNLKFSIILLGLLLFLLSSLTYAQEDLMKTFRIEGTVNRKTGNIKIEKFPATDYYPVGIDDVVAEIANYKFVIEGQIPYPQGFTLSFEDYYYSNVFVIDPGTQQLVCNVDSVGETPIVSNSTMMEYELYSDAFLHVVKGRDLLRLKRDSLLRKHKNALPSSEQFKLDQELKGYYVESDSILLRYVESRPNSYLAFWKFANLFRFVGYEPIYESIFSQFSDSIKTTYTGETISNKIELAKSLKVGSKFPVISLVDIDHRSIDSISFSKYKYTLVDFWYSGCRPCIVQFPHLRNLYEKYENVGFEIVGISTDKKNFNNKWIRAIDNYKLNWAQYWDVDGKESKNLSINVFPANFLVDKNGRIINKNITPTELEFFLDSILRSK